MGMDSWNELMNPRRSQQLFDTPEYAAGGRCAIPTMRVFGLACRACSLACPRGQDGNPSKTSASKKTLTATGAKNTRG